MQLRKLSTRATACAAGLAATVTLGVVGQATAAPIPADTPAHTAATHSTVGATGTAAVSPKKTGAGPIGSVLLTAVGWSSP
ncbi:hypothetical protein GCM10018987_19490 [Streptomyces cremeus]